MKTAIASVQWLSHEDGGRQQPPTGEEPPVYWAVVKFIDHDSSDGPPTNGWSLNVKKIELMGDVYNWRAEIEFRVEEAPHDLLALGSHFELYEGKKKVAIGEITEAVN